MNAKLFFFAFAILLSLTLKIAKFTLKVLVFIVEQFVQAITVEIVLWERVYFEASSYIAAVRIFKSLILLAVDAWLSVFLYFYWKMLQSNYRKKLFWLFNLV